MTEFGVWGKCLVAVVAAFLGMGEARAGIWRTGSLETWGRDPSYAVYQRYRYAYEKYGYLFPREEEGTVPGGNVGVSGGEFLSASGKAEIGADGSGAAGSGADGGRGVGSGVDGSWETGSGTAGETGLAGSAATLNALDREKLQSAISRLQDYDYLIKHYYSVHASTTADREIFQAEELLGTDIGLSKNSEEPQILIYHTHSQETYADYGPGNLSANVTEAGAYLAELLRKKGWNVIHDTDIYDVRDGKLDRSRAYNYALEGITGILQEHPSIEVILDLHRDGVQPGTHLVSEVNGKPTANIMFFLGLSRTPEGVIEYLPNPYIRENLAFAFQMQLLAEQLFPGYTRKIYLKGLRYNLHLRKRSALIEVGAQTNTLVEAKNAMEPLAELLDTVLRGN